MPSQPTTIVWRRFGKEHGEDEFRRNDDAIVRLSLEEKVEHARSRSTPDCPWHRISDQLLIERIATTTGCTCGVLCYFPARGCLIEDRWDDAGNSVEWRIHVGATGYDESLSSWVFTDWFVDILLDPASGRYLLEDLDDLALVHELGIVDDALLHRILQTTQNLLHTLETDFPPVEMTKRGAIMRQLGWL
jgi:hypothetical protein